MKNKSYFGDKFIKVKLYKKGKLWITASLTFITLGMTSFVTVKADDLTISSISSEQQRKVIQKFSTQSNSIQSSSRSCSSSEKTASSSSISSSLKKGSVKSINVPDQSEIDSNSKQLSITYNPTINRSQKSSDSYSSSLKMELVRQKKSEDETLTNKDEFSINKKSIHSKQFVKASSNDELKSLNNKRSSSSLLGMVSTKLNNVLNFNLLKAKSAEKQQKESMLYEDWGEIIYNVYFKDENSGNEICNTITGTVASSVQSETEAAILKLENEGWQYDFGISNASTAKLEFYRLQQGGAVMVRYVDTATGKVLQISEATYQDENGEIAKIPYVGFTYTTNSIGITGYTLSSIPGNVSGNVTTKPQTVTYKYTPNKEHAVVNYVDDNTGKIVASQTVDGTFGESITYDPTSEENTLKNEGYTIGSNNLPAGDKITFNQDGQVPTYTVHLNEGTTTITPSNNPDKLELTKTVTRIINYVDDNGKTLAPSVTQTITFTRTATVNKVTGEIEYSNWKQSRSDSYNTVNSPVIDGYTTTQMVINAEDNISSNSSDEIINVVYTAKKPATPVQKSTKNVEPSSEDTVKILVTKAEKETQNKPVKPKEGKKTLPQTGESSTSESLWGSLLIGLSGILSLFGLAKKKEKDNN